jgi:aldos-2-ulose dehydratase/isomerase family protein/VCBS repeat protein
MNWRRFLVILTLLGASPASKSPPYYTQSARSESPRFVEQELEGQFDVGYAVITTDVNRDGKIDIVAINPTQAIWFENPTWKKHTIMNGLTKKDNVCIAAADIDGDGRIDLALGAEWMPANTQSGGSLQWLRQPEKADVAWSLFPIGSEPTLHRIRWADVDGDGRPELVVAPLQGRGTKAPDWAKGNGVRLLLYHIPANPTKNTWPVEVIDQSLHALHNFLVVNFDNDPADEIITASLEGVFLFDRGADGKWTKRKLGEGNAEENETSGAGEIKLGKFRSGRKYLATIEPWHGNQVVAYLPPEEEGDLWDRRVLDAKLKQAHALWCADMDGDGDDELVVGWREASEPTGRSGIALYDTSDEDWVIGRKYLIADGGMATEDLTVADLNKDGLPDIIAVGRATHNVKIYWNQGTGK